MHGDLALILKLMRKMLCLHPRSAIEARLPSPVIQMAFCQPQRLVQKLLVVKNAFVPRPYTLVSHD